MKNQSAQVQIQTISALEAIVGKTPGPRDLKVIDFLDEHALRFISASPCLFNSHASQTDRQVRVLIAGGEPGFVKADSHSLSIPLDSLDHSENIKPGDGWGSLFIIPTLKESLRVNGKVSDVTASAISVDVSECYLHCAKAFMRSKLWEDYEIDQSVSSQNEFCDRTRFMLVATCDSELRADLSPKGDPAGKLLQLNDEFAWYPDRPGNRRVDGFRNILQQQKIEIVALLSGTAHVLRISGEAVIFSDHPQINKFEENNKMPKIVVRIKPINILMEDSLALKRAKLWPPQKSQLNIKASEIWQDHMKLSKVSGLEATLAKVAISVPGVLQKGLEWDYKNNLY